MRRAAVRRTEQASAQKRSLSQHQQARKRSDRLITSGTLSLRGAWNQESRVLRKAARWMGWAMEQKLSPGQRSEARQESKRRGERAAPSLPTKGA
eukprot:2850802-Karenia_brevis.AAC.1